MKYLAFYNTDENSTQKRDVAVSVTTKLKYILECLEKNEIECQVISTSGTTGHAFMPKTDIKISENITLELPFSLGRSCKVVRVLDRWQIKVVTLFKLLKISKNETVVAYHSVPIMRILAFAKRIKKFRLILEAEEIYGDVKNKPKLSEREMRYFKLADAYIFPTQLLDEKINTSKKPSVIIHGTYKYEEERNCRFDDDKIHVVYAGTLEQRKGAGIAVETAKYLDERYHLHIMGFGTDEVKNELIEKINSVSKNLKAELTFEGSMSGEEYIEFIQSCHIGLSPQQINASFNETSFPSKVLSYLSNGLQVVASEIKSLKYSKVNALLHYYEGDSPESMAKAIKSIEITDNCKNKEIIKKLDEEFTRDLKELLIH